MTPHRGSTSRLSSLPCWSSATMRTTVPRLIRVLPRTALQTTEKKIIPRPAPQYGDLIKPSVIDLLSELKDKAGSDWPSNIRIEPIITKDAFKSVRPELRTRLKSLLRET